ncbi:MAG TPA: hypothetical protein VK603_10750, partial [Candidatus Saccharimonadales bacterium]|nr:hypothetical protein [Candidatus Saccharimonadales bacterium]
MWEPNSPKVRAISATFGKKGPRNPMALGSVNCIAMAERLTINRDLGLPMLEDCYVEVSDYRNRR